MDASNRIDLVRWHRSMYQADQVRFSFIQKNFDENKMLKTFLDAKRNGTSNEIAYDRVNMIHRI